MPLNYTVRCTKDDRYQVIRVATGEERGVYDTYGEAASCQDALEQGYRAACQTTGAPLIEPSAPAARDRTTTDRLLEMAYDAEQQGNLIIADGLRRMAHDPAFFAVVARELDERDSSAPVDQATVERRRAIFRLFDEALGLNDDESKSYDAELECTVWDRGDTRIYFDHRQGRISTVSALGTLCDIHTDEDLEDLRDLMALLDRPDVRAAIGGQPSPLAQARPAYPDGEYLDPIETVISTERGITCTRVETAPDRAWLDFTIGTKGEDDRVLVSVDILGGRPGCELLIAGNSINGKRDHIITLADLTQLRDGLSAMLADERLLAAFAKQG